MTETEIAEIAEDDDDRPVWRSPESARRMLDKPSRGFMERLERDGILEVRKIGKRKFISDKSIRRLQPPEDD